MNKYRQKLPPLASLLPFEAAARLGSITLAGEELGLTQAAVSRQIKSLEENLGVRLFDRRNRAIHLTEQGEVLHSAVSQGLETISLCSDRLRQKQESNTVTLFSQLCEGLYWVMPRLSGFYQQHPSVQVNVPVSTRPIIESSDYFDLALQTSGRKSGDYRKIFSVADEVFPVCSPDYIENANHPFQLDQLHHHHLLHLKVHPQDWIGWDDWLQQIGSESRVDKGGTIYDSYPMMVQAAIEGHGIALGWQKTSEHLLASGALVKPFAESMYLTDGLSVYMHPQCEMRPEVGALVDWLKAELSK